MSLKKERKKNHCSEWFYGLCNFIEGKSKNKQSHKLIINHQLCIIILGLQEDSVWVGIKLRTHLLASKWQKEIESLWGESKFSSFQPYDPLNLQKHIRYNSLPLLTCIKYNIEVLIFCFLNIDIYCCASLYTHFESGIRYTSFLR